MIMMNNLEATVNNRFETVMLQLAQQREFMMQQFNRINNNIRRYGGTITSAFANQARQASGERPPQAEPSTLFGMYGTIDRRATLSPCPKDLYQLWQEWTVGIDGRKAAKDFTQAERNQKLHGIKQKFYRRLLIWQTQA